MPPEVGSSGNLKRKTPGGAGWWRTSPEPGESVNYKRLYQLYCLEGLQMRPQPPRPNQHQVAGGSHKCRPIQTVSVQGIHAGALCDGRRPRLLTIVDDLSRVSPYIGVGSRHGAMRCLRPQPDAGPIWHAGRPPGDRGPEFIAEEWAPVAYPRA
jgi:hypothetical protein